MSDRQITDDALSVAAPVRGPDGTVTAAVSVVVPCAGVQVPTLVPAVRPAERGMSRALGRHPARTGRPVPDIPRTGEDTAPRGS